MSEGKKRRRARVAAAVLACLAKYARHCRRQRLKSTRALWLWKLQAQGRAWRAMVAYLRLRRQKRAECHEALEVRAPIRSQNCVD